MIKYRFGNWSCWKDYCGDSSQTWTIKTMLSQNKNTWSEHFLTITNNNKGGKPYLKIARKVLWERYLKIIACRIPKTSGEKTNNWLKATSLNLTRFETRLKNSELVSTRWNQWWNFAQFPDLGFKATL
jgi:hypothetical protein